MRPEEKYRLLVFLVLLFLSSISLAYLEHFEKNGERKNLIKKLPTYGENLELPPFRPPKERKVKKAKYSVALIIDDVGNGKEMVYRVAELPTAITPSVLPFREYSLWATLYLKSRGFDVMLHLPMQPQNPELIEKGMLTVGMDKAEMEKRLREAFRNVPFPVGINNHEGSLFTSSQRAMRVFFSLIKNREIFFVDSWTTGSSVGLALAKKMGIPALRRDVFLDNLQDEYHIRKQWEILLETARRKGFALGIAHARWGTMAVLPKLLSSLPPDFSLVRVRSLVAKSSLTSNKKGQRIREGQ